VESIYPAVHEFADSLRALYGNRLVKLVLYGSWARGTGRDDSDIDLLVVLKECGSPGIEIDVMIDAIDYVNLKYDVLLSVYPVSEAAAKEEKSPLLMNIRREGVVV
jgi:uncharacterized protein